MRGFLEMDNDLDSQIGHHGGVLPLPVLMPVGSSSPNVYIHTNPLPESDDSTHSVGPAPDNVSSTATRSAVSASPAIIYLPDDNAPLPTEPPQSSDSSLLECSPSTTTTSLVDPFQPTALSTPSSSYNPAPKTSGAIPSPLPISSQYVLFLEKRDTLKHSELLTVVRHIYSIMRLHVDGKPSKKQRDDVAREIVSRFPCLAKREEKHCDHFGLSYAANNYERSLKKKLPGIGPTRDVTPEERMRVIHSLEGELRAALALAKYPEYKESGTLILDLAYLTGQNKSDLIKDSRKRFMSIKAKAKALAGRDKGEIAAVFDLLSRLAGNDISPKLVIAFRGDEPDTEQPFVLYDSIVSPGTGSIVVDRKVFIKLPQDGIFWALLYLMATYFALNLTYPQAASKIYKFLEYHLLGEGTAPAHLAYKVIFG